jgi:hypothetical protein
LAPASFGRRRLSVFRIRENGIFAPGAIMRLAAKRARDPLRIIFGGSFPREHQLNERANSEFSLCILYAAVNYEIRLFAAV